MRTSPLNAWHRRADAKLVEFGGWEMPLAYSSGTVAEHLACRQAAAVFDVSHLGTVRVRGEGSFDVLQRLLTNDLAKIGPGRCQYTHLLTPAGGVADDIIVWWRDGDVFDVMPNASNTERILSALASSGAPDVADVTADRAVIALQGPSAVEILEKAFSGVTIPGRFRVLEAELCGAGCQIAGTGYTGEPGVEIAIDAAASEQAWSQLVEAGATPAGLGARDTLRLEAGLPLHGHELGTDMTPLDAGLDWVIGWQKDFIGKAALVEQRERGLRRRLVGLMTATKRPPRAEMEVTSGGEVIGIVSSGNYSPCLEVGIALAFVDAAIANGAIVEINARGSRIEATVSELPFPYRVADRSAG